MKTLRSTCCLLALMGGAALWSCGDDDDDETTDGAGDGDGDGDTSDAGAGDDGDGDGDDGGAGDDGDGDEFQLSGEVSDVEGTAPASECTSTTEASVEDGCYGFYCGTNSNSLDAALTDDSVCSGDPTIWLICNGDTVHAASTCAREHALDEDPEAGMRECLRAVEELEPVSDGCLECYVESATCARENCLSDCLAGDSVQCDDCREEAGCTPGFYTCAGLPNPQ